MISHAAIKAHTSSHMSPNSKNCHICDFSSIGSENLSQHIVRAHFKSTEMLHLSSIPDSVGYYHCDACVAWKTILISYLKRHSSKIHHGAESLPGKALKIQHSGDPPPLEYGNANIPDEILDSCSAGGNITMQRVLLMISLVASWTSREMLLV